MVHFVDAAQVLHSLFSTLSPPDSPKLHVQNVQWNNVGPTQGLLDCCKDGGLKMRRLLR